MLTLKFVSLLLLEFIRFSSSASIENDRLIFAQTVCRHGDRNIYSTFPTDPWKSVDFWPGGMGALTDIGKMEHYALGKQLFERYAELIGNDISSKTIYIQSTDTQRTLKSVDANLAGFLSLDGDQYQNDDSNRQSSIPVETFPGADDYLLATSKKCDRFDYLMLEYLHKNNSYSEFFEYFKPLVTHLEANSGSKITRILDLLLLYNTLTIEKAKLMKIPDWAEEVVKTGGDLEQITLYWYQLHTGTNEMKKIKAGFLLKEIFDRFSKKIKSNLSPDVSLWMHFAHDVTIINVLNSLGVYEPHFPPYASCILFELYKSNDIPYVQIFYKNSTETFLPAIEIPNCGQKCSLHQLYKLYKDILPTKSFDEECLLRDGETVRNGGNPESYIVHVNN